eukprot:2186263-Rhodomonas_salina.2
MPKVWIAAINRRASAPPTSLALLHTSPPQPVLRNPERHRVAGGRKPHQGWPGTQNNPRST